MSNTERVMKVMVVEDEELLRRMMQRALRRGGYEMVGASTGAQAMELAKAHDDVEVIVIDRGLPGLDGVTVARALSQHYPGVKVVLMSGLVDESMKRAGEEVGAYRILEKPFRPRTLLEILESVRTSSARWSVA
ncbi:MAG: response regulator [Myxococcota bacterium]